jgi:hypothetical protein
MTSTQQQLKEESWHLSKSIPLTLIFAIICQTIALIWFVASLSNDVDAATRELTRQDARITNLEALVQSQAVSMARIDENLAFIRKAVETLAATNTFNRN